ncbi:MULTISPECIES: hypothetical protein [unclassified Gilliamella]|uniref:hypothetical protein n=1 Tax=unclassified Gilliamella TaxID=2685620 RepID=UPI00132154CF|nr:MULTISPECIES: hypothetical protein [unclassified Gilliamella]MWN32794.1 hypothetical protein [Gilliamella sp. Pra-s60]MWP30277.1 hypothetical protein [Gilliamella sp. Pra-s54]
MNIFNVKNLLIISIGILLIIILCLFVKNPENEKVNSLITDIDSLIDKKNSQQVNSRYKLFFNYLKQQETDYSIKDNHIYISDDLYIDDDEAKFILPNNLSIEGDLYLNNDYIRELPNNLSVKGDLILYKTKINQLPEDLHASSISLPVEQFNNIAYRQEVGSDDITLFAVFIDNEIKISVPAWRFLGNLNTFDAKVDEEYSQATEDEYQLEIEKYKQAAQECVNDLIEMRKNQANLLIVQEQYKDFFKFLDYEKIEYSFKNNNIIIDDIFKIRDSSIQLPDNLSISADFKCDGSKVTQLPQLPYNLSIGGEFEILSCGILTELPNRLFVDYLNLGDSFITQLPDDLSVNYLFLRDSFISQLPNNLSVGQHLDLRGTPITRLPDNLKVGKSLILDVRRIRNIAYREYIGEDRITLFSVFVNGEIQISVPSWKFLGNLKSFERKIDANYQGVTAQQYKQAAKECVDELIEMRKNNVVNNNVVNNNVVNNNQITTSDVENPKAKNTIKEAITLSSTLAKSRQEDQAFFNKLHKYPLLETDRFIYINYSWSDEWIDSRRTPITKISNRLFIKGSMDLSETMLTRLPNKLYVKGLLNISDTVISELPDGIYVNRLNASNTRITKLPDNFYVYGDLYFNNTPITELPSNLLLKGDMDLSDTPITKLPDNLSVGGNLKLNNTNITTLPENLSVGKGLDLDVQKITNIVYREHVGEDDIKLFSVFNNGEIQISVPSWKFLGNLKSFESKIDKNFSEVVAKQYKQVAQDCIDELAKRRNTNRSI